MKAYKVYFQEDPFSTIVLTAAVLIGIFYLIKYFVDKANESDEDVVDPAAPERGSQYWTPPARVFASVPSGTGSMGMGSVGGVSGGFGGGARAGSTGGKGGAL